MTKEDLSDWSNKWSEDTYGIYPIAYFLVPMGLFLQILPDEFLRYFMRSEETYGINPIA